MSTFFLFSITKQMFAATDHVNYLKQIFGLHNSPARARAHLGRIRVPISHMAIFHSFPGFLPSRIFSQN
jgi:hypothetical protein